jgi:hypothetical protein
VKRRMFVVETKHPKSDYYEWFHGYDTEEQAREAIRQYFKGHPHKTRVTKWVEL